MTIPDGIECPGCMEYRPGGAFPRDRVICRNCCRKADETDESIDERISKLAENRNEYKLEKDEDRKEHILLDWIAYEVQERDRLQNVEAEVAERLGGGSPKVS